MPTHSTETQNGTLKEGEYSITRNSEFTLHDFFERPPHWLVRFGTSIFFILTLLLFALSWFIRYPDKIETKVSISSENPPIDVPCLGAGKIAALLVKEQDVVVIGQTLAVLQSQVGLEDVTILEQKLTNLLQNDDIDTDIPAFHQLGELYQFYTPLVQVLQEWKYIAAKSDVALKNAALSEEQQQLTQLNTSLERQTNIYNAELNLAESEFNRMLRLCQLKVVSIADKEAAESKFLQAIRQKENLWTSRQQNQAKIQQLRHQQKELSYNRSSELQGKTLQIRQAANNLKAAIDQWKKQHLILAPISGVVNLLPTITVDKYVDKYVQENTPIITILPQQHKGRVIVYCQTPTEGSGKIAIHDRIVIRVDAFPYKEYGLLETKVARIAPMPQLDDQKRLTYRIEAYLPDTLTTTYHKIIPFQQRMTGTAYIITQERRLLERFFDKFVPVETL